MYTSITHQITRFFVIATLYANIHPQVNAAEQKQCDVEEKKQVLLLEKEETDVNQQLSEFKSAEKLMPVGKLYASLIASEEIDFYRYQDSKQIIGNNDHDKKKRVIFSKQHDIIISKGKREQGLGEDLFCLHSFIAGGNATKDYIVLKDENFYLSCNSKYVCRASFKVQNKSRYELRFKVQFSFCNGKGIYMGEELEVGPFTIGGSDIKQFSGSDYIDSEKAASIKSAEANIIDVENTSSCAIL